MKKKTLLILAAVIVAVIAALPIVNAVAARNTVIKTAVKEQDLPEDGNYIICDWTEVTGFNWYVSSSAGMGKRGTWCNIIGPSPYDLHLDYEFTVARNQYVFYVESVREYYSKEIQEHVTEYTVTGWDILYPVRRESMLTLLKPPGCIIENDLWKEP